MLSDHSENKAEKQHHNFFFENINNIDKPIERQIFKKK